jgi:hypothetical protein
MTMTPVATAKVTRIAVATVSGPAAAMSNVPDATAINAAMAEDPAMSPRLRDRLRKQEIRPAVLEARSS